MKGKKGCRRAIFLGCVLVLAPALLQLNSRAGNAQSQTPAQTPGEANGSPPAQQQPGQSEAEQLISGSDCSSCHAADQKVVGPSYNDIAMRYKGQPGAVDQLVAKVKQGGAGNWGTIAMPPHPSLTDEQLKVIVQWILSSGVSQTAPPAAAATQPEASAKTYTYALPDGSTVQLDFPLFVDAKGPKVTKDVFHGYENFNSYCYRCHGQDATGSEIAPDLRHSLATGMTEDQFMTTAMVGREDKGMPSWAGFLSKEEVNQIYEYVKGRSLDLVPVGRPPSEMD